ncbi:MAG: EAL domain-containing protein [Solirubrobacterales bacterium]
MTAELWAGLESDELEIHLQSEVWLEDGSHFGYEAQPRWTHPKGKTIDGPQLLGQVENTALALPVARRLVERACEELESRDHNRPDASVSIALPALEDPRIAETVSAALAATETRPGRLCLEVSARRPIESFDAARESWFELHEAGVGFALEGCGSETLPIGPLAVFPFDFVRLDASLIRAVSHSAQARRMVATIARAAAEREAITVADGIETNTETIAAFELGCRVAQGPRFGRPLPPRTGGRVDRTRPAAVPSYS